MAIAERHAGAELRQLALPPDSLPIESVRSKVRSYRTGVVDEQQLTAAVDLHGEALEIEIARTAADHAAEFQRTAARLEVLAGYVSLRVAQLDWLGTFSPRSAARSYAGRPPSALGHAGR